MMPKIICRPAAPGDHIYGIWGRQGMRNATFVAANFLEFLGDCAACHTKISKRRFPAEIEYIGGEPVDFPQGMPLLLASEAAATELAWLQGVEIKQVLPYAGKPTYKRLPTYTGPPLVELWFTHNIPYDPSAPWLTITKHCPECGVVGAEVKGVDMGMESDFGWTWWCNPNRALEDGMRIKLSDLQGNLAFRYGGARKMVLQPVKEFIQDKGYTNVLLIDFGEVVDG